MIRRKSPHVPVATAQRMATTAVRNVRAHISALVRAGLCAAFPSARDDAGKMKVSTSNCKS